MGDEAELSNGSEGNGNGSGSGNGNGAIRASAAAELKYSAMLESRLNPWLAFQARTRAERLASLSPIDWLSINLTKLLLHKQATRIALLAYTAFLHLLVFLVLWSQTAEKARQTLSSPPILHTDSQGTYPSSSL